VDETFLLRSVFRSFSLFKDLIPKHNVKGITHVGFQIRSSCFWR